METTKQRNVRPCRARNRIYTTALLPQYHSHVSYLIITVSEALALPTEAITNPVSSALAMRRVV